MPGCLGEMSRRNRSSGSGRVEAREPEACCPGTEEVVFFEDRGLQMKPRKNGKTNGATTEFRGMKLLVGGGDFGGMTPDRIEHMLDMRGTILPEGRINKASKPRGNRTHSFENMSESRGVETSELSLSDVMRKIA